MRCRVQRDEDAHAITSHCLELADEFVDVGDLDARLPLRRLGDLERLQARRDVDAIIGGGLLSSGFDFAFMMFGSEA
jgi:hypothetical protein